MKKLLILSILIVSILILGVNLSYADSNKRNWILSPITLSPLLSFQFAQIEGYGLDIRYRKISLSVFRVSHRSYKISELLQLSDNWVYTRQGTFLELNYRFFQTSVINFGLGLNELFLGTNSYLGYHIFIEKNIDNFAFIRLGFRDIKNDKSLTINLGFDILEAINKFYQQLLLRYISEEETKNPDNSI